MPASLVTMVGLEEVQRMLAEAPKHVVVLGFAKALRAGADVIEQTLATSTPESNLDREDRVPLVDALMAEVEVDLNAKGGSASVGFGKLGYIANMVEYGHVMVTHAPGKKVVGFVPPHPFMRPAFESSAEPAIAAFAASMTETVKNEFPQ